MKIEGTYDQLVEILVRDTKISEGAADAVLSMIMDNPELLDSVEIEHGSDVYERGVAGLLFGDKKYYISFNRTILPLILLTVSAARCLLMSINSTDIMNAVISLMPTIASFLHNGGLEDSVILLDERNGEKCILLELLKNRRESITAEIIKKQMGNHCEKEYHCDYKINGKCTCSKDEIEKILRTLEKRNVLKGGSAGYRHIT